MTDNQVFGVEDIKVAVKALLDSPQFKTVGKEMVLASMLSDSQELMLLGDFEGARQQINIVKYMLCMYSLV